MSLLQLLQHELPCNAVVEEHPQHTFTATPTCRSHSGTVLYETYETGQKNMDVYHCKLYPTLRMGVMSLCILY